MLALLYRLIGLPVYYSQLIKTSENSKKKKTNLIEPIEIRAIKRANENLPYKFNNESFLPQFSQRYDPPLLSPTFLCHKTILSINRKRYW